MSKVQNDCYCSLIDTQVIFLYSLLWQCLVDDNTSQTAVPSRVEIRGEELQRSCATATQHGRRVAGAH